MMDKTATIRLANADDITGICAVYYDAAAELKGTEHWSEIGLRKPDDGKLIQACDEGRLWVAIDQSNNVTGFGMVSKVGEQAFIEHLSVAQSHTRNGIARAIADKIYNWAISNEFEAVSSSTYRDVVPGLMFFFNIGYSIISDRDFDPSLTELKESEESLGLRTDTRTFLSIKTGVSKQTGKNPIRQSDMSDIGQLTSIRHRTTETQIRIFSKGIFPGKFYYRTLHQLLNSGNLFSATDEKGNVVGFSVVEPLGNCLHISEVAAQSGENENSILKDLLSAAIRGAKLAELPTVTVASFQLLNRQNEVLRSLGFSQLNEDHAPPELSGILNREKHETANSGRLYFWLNLADHRKNR